MFENFFRVSTYFKSIHDIAVVTKFVRLYTQMHPAETHPLILH